MTTKAQDIAKRIFSCRKRHGWTMKETAARLGVTQSRYSNWEQEIRSPKYEQVEALADLFNVNPSWIVGWTEHAGTTPESDYITADRKTINIGGEGVTLDQVVSTTAFSPEYISQRGLDPKNVIQLKIQDDSMEPIICAGDEILINRSQKHVERPDLFALVVNDRVWVRRIRPEIDGSFTLTCENKDLYPDQSLSTLDKLNILGRVCRIARDR